MDKIMSFNGELVDFGKCMGCTIANSYEINAGFVLWFRLCPIAKHTS